MRGEAFMSSCFNSKPIEGVGFPFTYETTGDCSKRICLPRWLSSHHSLLNWSASSATYRYRYSTLQGVEPDLELKLGAPTPLELRRPSISWHETIYSLIIYITTWPSNATHFNYDLKDWICLFFCGPLPVVSTSAELNNCLLVEFNGHSRLVLKVDV